MSTLSPSPKPSLTLWSPTSQTAFRVCSRSHFGFLLVQVSFIFVPFGLGCNLAFLQVSSSSAPLLLATLLPQPQMPLRSMMALLHQLIFTSQRKRKHNNYIQLNKLLQFILLWGCFFYELAMPTVFWEPQLLFLNLRSRVLLADGPLRGSSTGRYFRPADHVSDQVARLSSSCFASKKKEACLQLSDQHSRMTCGQNEMILWRKVSGFKPFISAE